MKLNYHFIKSLEKTDWYTVMLTNLVINHDLLGFRLQTVS